MNGELTWNGIKKELWKEKPNVLMKKLQELETEKQRVEVYLRMNGHSAKRYAYQNKVDTASGNIRKEFRSGNLNQIKKQIACVKTMLNVKLKVNT